MVVMGAPSFVPHLERAVRGRGEFRLAMSPNVHCPVEGKCQANSCMPEAAAVGRRAAEILDDVRKHPAFDRLHSSSVKYSDCWATFTDYPAISRWSLDRDAGPLPVEALRVLALKAAVFELSGGDEEASELPLSSSAG